MRGLADKVAAVRREIEPSWTVAGLLVLRSTTRNRSTVRELRDLLAARFPARSTAWLACLSDPARPMPAGDGDGLAWSTVARDRLYAARLG